MRLTTLVEAAPVLFICFDFYLPLSTLPSTMPLYSGGKSAHNAMRASLPPEAKSPPSPGEGANASVCTLSAWHRSTTNGFPGLGPLKRYALTL